jgi:hypothetical protein
MINFTLRQGETLRIAVESDRPDATDVEFTIDAIDTSDAPLLLKQTATFTSGVAEIVFTAVQTANIKVGQYEYMVTVNHSNGDVEKLPDANCQDGSCELPKVIVCKTLE